MPLKPGEDVGTAIKELYHHGSRPRSREQIIAIAEANHRRRAPGGGIPGVPGSTLSAPGGRSTFRPPRPMAAPHPMAMPHMRLAGGGFSLSDSVPFFERNEARELQSDDTFHPAGLFPGSGAGRTDQLPRAVAADSFVMPADVVSGLGEGNSLAGAKIMDAILSAGGPYGTPRPNIPRISYADGGQVEKPGISRVMVAPGEYLAHKNQLMNVGYRRRAKGKRDVKPEPKADLAEGHVWAREFVDKVRHHVKKFLAKAPKPKK